MLTWNTELIQCVSVDFHSKLSVFNADRLFTVTSNSTVRRFCWLSICASGVFDILALYKLDYYYYYYYYFDDDDDDDDDDNVRNDYDGSEIKVFTRHTAL